MALYLTLLTPQQSWQEILLIYKKHIDIKIGQYYQVHEEDTPSNSNKSRNNSDICIESSKSIQGGFKFMRLRSMKNITRQSWDMIPMHDIVIDRVNILKKYQPELLVFTDRKVQLIGDGNVKITEVGGDGDKN